MGVLAHGPLQEVDLAAMPLQLLQQHHLVHVGAGQPVGGGDEHAVQRRCRYGVAQPVQTRPLQARATEAVVAEDVLLPQVPLLPGMSRHLRWAGAPPVVQCSHASACRAVETRAYTPILCMGHLLRRCWAPLLRSSVSLTSGRPPQDRLIGAVPASLPVREGACLPAKAPSLFHGCLPGEPPHREKQFARHYAFRASATGSATMSS
jgi:hypothetical protein